MKRVHPENGMDDIQKLKQITELSGGYSKLNWVDGKKAYYPARDEGTPRPITDDVIRAHLDGSQPIGINMNTGDGKSHFAVFDFDDHDGSVAPQVMRTRVGFVAGVLYRHGTPHFVVRSGGGRGYHIWIVFERASRADYVRKRMREILNEANTALAQSPWDHEKFVPDDGKGKGMFHSTDTIHARSPRPDQPDSYKAEHYVELLPKDGEWPVIALPLDRHGDKDGFAELEDMGIECSSEFYARTAGNGEHHMFEHTPGLLTSNGEIAPGIDIKSEAASGTPSYIVAPGTVAPWGKYQWIKGSAKALADALEMGCLVQVPDGLQTHRAAKRRETKTEKPPVAPNLDKLRSALSYIPNDLAYDEWRKILMAVHFETGGSEEGLGVVIGWSAGYGKFSVKEVQDKWGSFGKSDGKPITGGTLFKMAREHGWDDPIALLTEEDVEPGDRYGLTEHGIIESFVDRHAGELVWDHDVGAWFRFDGHVWRPEKTQLARDYAKKRTMELAALDPKAKNLHRVHVWEAVERGVKPDRAIAVTADTWNRDPYLLGTPGGVVNLRTGELRPGRPDDYISKSTAVAPDFDMPHPIWDAFLMQALKGDRDAIGFLQRFSGYTLTGLTIEQVLLFIYGRGKSGKTTTLETLSDIMLDYAVSMATSTLTKTHHAAHSQELARLHGARLAYCSETEKGAAWAENRIKSLTGGDRVTARFMRQNDFEFVPELKLVIVGNNQPSLSDVDSAIRRRFLILPFDNPPEKADPTLREKLQRESPAILAWAIRGALDWQKKKTLAPPSVVTKATENYFEAQDVFAQWLADECEVAEDHVELADVLYKSWSSYAVRNGVTPGSRNKAFPETMQQRDFEQIKDTMGLRGRGYRGLWLKDSWRALI